VGTGVGIGMALGAFFSGWVVDAYGARNGFWVSVAAGILALSIVAMGQKKLAVEKKATNSYAEPASASVAQDPAS
jgi:predicted MFS family arabinose efflux permease